MERLKLSELLAATGGVPIDVGADELCFDRIEIDSRSVTAGVVFWALRGDRHDGHDYLQQARQKGAVAAVVSEKHRERVVGPAIVVKETQQALWDYSGWRRRQHDPLIVGVTGSVGKTTAREMIFATMSAGFQGTRSQKNFNNHIGVPLSLLEIEDRHEFAVLEMGASRVGEIQSLAELTEPDIGVVTGIGPAHLEGFGSIEGIIAAKGELLEALPSNGLAVVDGDDERTRLMAERAGCPVLFVGTGPGNDIRPTDIRCRNGQLEFSVDSDRFSVASVGSHHIVAALVAVAIGREVGMSPKAIAEGLKNYRPVTGRGVVENIGTWTVIDDTYNANPSSMLAACQTLKDWTGGNHRVLIVGDMLELGREAEQYHYQLGQVAAESNIDRLMAYGAHAGDVIRGARDCGMDVACMGEFQNLETIAVVLDCWLEPDDVLLVKGSRGMRMERIIERLRQRSGTAVVNENLCLTGVRRCA